MAKPKAPKKKWHAMTPEEKQAHKVVAAARNKKRLETYNPVKAAINAWRREFSRSPVVIDMMNNPETKRNFPKFNKDGTRAKIDAVEHLCNICDEWKRSSKNSKVAIDHVEPFIDPVTGFVDFNTCHKRLWCEPSNLQKVCGDCHNKKSAAENYVRMMKVEFPELLQMEVCDDPVRVKKFLKRYTPERLAKFPYEPYFLKRLTLLRAKYPVITKKK